MIAHGICSSGLFCLVNLYYIEAGGRLMLITKGIINYNLILILILFSFFRFSYSLYLLCYN